MIYQEKFAQIIVGMHGDYGARWLADLPKIIQEIEAKWSIKVDEPFANLSYHFVAPCICSDGSSAVLKTGIFDVGSPLINEKRALEFYDGRMAVQIHRFDEELNALLLEKLTPGVNLIKVCQQNDTKATSIAIKVMLRLRRRPPITHIFPSLEKWTNGLKKARKTNFPIRFAEKALEYFAELAPTHEQNWFLHGDLHHENILSATRESFLAIDPKGIVGGFGYEISVFLNNPLRWILSQSNPKMVLNRRVEQFAEAFEIESHELKKWAFAQAVLSNWWTFEEIRDISKFSMTLAELWEE